MVPGSSEARRQSKARELVACFRKPAVAMDSAPCDKSRPARRQKQLLEAAASDTVRNINIRTGADHIHSLSKLILMHGLSKASRHGFKRDSTTGCVHSQTSGTANLLCLHEVRFKKHEPGIHLARGHCVCEQVASTEAHVAETCADAITTHQAAAFGTSTTELESRIAARQLLQ